MLNMSWSKGGLGVFITEGVAARINEKECSEITIGNLLQHVNTDKYYSFVNKLSESVPVSNKTP